MEAKIAYLGPSGTNCEEAARRIIDTDQGWELVSYASIDAVFAAVNDGRAVRGVVPIENSCEGSVNVTLDLLAYEYQLEIIGEIILPVRHNLLARSGVRIQDLSAVLSHPQALAQCRRYLGQHLDGVDCLDIPSTAEAACRVSSSDQPWAAIGTQAAARANGLQILAEGIQDGCHNETRFISLGQPDQNAITDIRLPTKNVYYKTSLILAVGHQPGALFKALEQFYLYDINMSKIESRPAKTRIGNYLFFIDIDGHHSEPGISKALQGLQGLVSDMRLLGSYRAASDRDEADCTQEAGVIADCRAVCL